MTTAANTAEQGTAPVDYDTLAADVAAAVSGPRSEAPAAAVVAAALRRRADGDVYAAIGREVGVSAKTAARWCRTAAELEPRFDAREAKPRRKRAAAATQPATKMLSARVDADLLGLVVGRAEAEGRSTTAVVEAALKSYVGRKVAGLETAVRRELRKRLKEELRALADAVSAHNVELRAQGRNLNQLTAFCNRYRELPVSVTEELSATRRALEENTAATERLHAAVLARFEIEGVR